jgi:hypothetical protein
MAGDEDTDLKLSKFNPSLVKPNSVMTIIGKRTNTKSFFKEYGKYFESPQQFKNVMENLMDNEALVIDQTSPHNCVQDILYIYTTK